MTTVKSVYQCMKQSNIKDVNGNNYPDVLTIGLDNFSYDNSFSYYYLTEQDITRFDLLMYKKYGQPYYDDLVLMLNNKYKNDLVVGEQIILPNKADLDLFFTNNKKVNR